MCVTQDYKILTIADRSEIRLALMMRQAQVENMLEDLKKMNEREYDRTRTQLKEELARIKAVIPKVTI